MNPIRLWYYLIGTPERAKLLRNRLDSLKAPPLDPLYGPEPKQCPLSVLYGITVSRKVYAEPDLRPALDMWDTGELGEDVLRKICFDIEGGGWKGAAFDPNSLPSSALLKLQADHRALLWQRNREAARETSLELRDSSRRPFRGGARQ